MIQDEGKYYLYRHIRLDENEVFYVGVGTKEQRWKVTSYKREYSRAFSKEKRSDFWKKIASKSEIKVEILLESDNYDFILQKEIEFIKLYGRRDLGLGTLCNLTDGGEGCVGLIMSENHKRKISVSQKGKPCNNQLWWDNNKHYRIKGEKHYVAKKVYQYDLDGNFIREWGCCKEVKDELNISINKSCVVNGGFQWKFVYEGEKINKPNWSNKRNIPVRLICSDANENPFICFYKIKDAADYFDSSTTTVSQAITLKFRLKRKYYIKRYDPIV